MNNKYFLIGVIGIIVAGVFYLTSSVTLSPEDDSSESVDYVSVSSEELEKMLENKDFVFIDVHTPEQEHIPSTDFMIPFDEVDKIESVIDNKDQKVVLYCRSGSMSKIAANELVERGYTNIYELNNGMNEWGAKGNNTVPKGSIETL
ncbi:MAG: rhodanese-like domain-containing protein [Candidatus Spechtbacterales bacterium]|nr:rhodanese-like domain-containing protein [Candidatus Spechtbacterales bacterium]